MFYDFNDSTQGSSSPLVQINVHFYSRRVLFTFANSGGAQHATVGARRARHSQGRYRRDAR